TSYEFDYDKKGDTGNWSGQPNWDKYGSWPTSFTDNSSLLPNGQYADITWGGRMFGVATFPLSGMREGNYGTLEQVGIHCGYWSSSAYSSDYRAYFVGFTKDEVSPAYPAVRSGGFFVRCIKN
ncbi:MAG: hypothetical protein LBB64_01990, partial [Dysgonamonadaceae bacterium]|nr:hypothetical protein [Dysgonamonadaceae bacterium]